MHTDFDHYLGPVHWEALKALRLSAGGGGVVHPHVLAELIDLELAVLSQGRACITASGRSVLLRGSPLLWDVAA